MGFSFKDFQDAADRKYAGLQIDDGPNGPINLRPSLRLTDSEQDALGDKQKEFEAAQARDDVKTPELRALMLDSLAIVADKPDDLRQYLAEADITVIMTVFTEYRNVVQAAQGN